MGRPKLLLPYRGGTVLGALLAALRDGGAAPIVVVAAPDNAPLRAWCRDAGAEDFGESPPDAGVGGGALRLALNPAPQRGMLSSILAGLAALGGAADLARRGIPLLVTPGDLPSLRATTVAHLARTATSAAAAGAQETPGTLLAVPTYHGKRGHPLWIAPPLLPTLDRLDPTRGLRHLLDLHPQALLEVETDDPGCLTDLDTPEDYERLSEDSPGQ
jgi:molybdenum cofactor cytidylyltransferase